MLTSGELTRQHVDELARTVAAFHAKVARAAGGDRYGTPASVAAPMRQNFTQMRAFLKGRGKARRLMNWSGGALPNTRLWRR